MAAVEITEVLPTDDSVLTEDDLSSVYPKILDLAPNWMDVGMMLGLRYTALTTVSATHRDNPKNCLRGVLALWLQQAYSVDRHGLPTWRKIVEVTADPAAGNNPALATRLAQEHQGTKQIAREPGNLQTARFSSELSNAVVVHTKYLQGRYQIQIPTFLNLQWPPRPVLKVLHLAMIRGRSTHYGSTDEDMVRLTLQGKINDILNQKTPVKLKDIFQMDNAKRKVILIEGAPGAGKSTLAWHICQQWGAGKLFPNFRTVVFIQLRDPAIQSANLLEDILPAVTRDQAEKVAAELIASSGKDLLFVLDGWDELPLKLHTNSIICKLIAYPEMLNLHSSTVIVTSRPVACGDLYQYRTISSYIEILGFTPAEVKCYFAEALEWDHKAVQKLQSQLKERPMIEASCYLPLNAAIVTHLFLAQNQSLPSTVHGVFTSLVICCLIRHMTKESQESCFSSLDNLPPCLQEPFKNICTLAFHGIMKNKITFSGGDLEQFRLPPKLDGLGLLQGIQSFTSFQKSLTYNFLHLSVQELLASLHISKLSGDEEVKIFEELFREPRFASVFKFYTAITKLKTKGIREIVVNIVKKKDKSQLLHLLNGLYEAQDLSLCQFVISQLDKQLDLSHTSLSPVDCLCIGYFLCSITGKFVIDFSHCSLDCYRISFLAKEFSKYNSSSKHSTDVVLHLSTDLDLNLSQNKIKDEGARAISKVVKVNQSLRTLNLSRNKIEAEGARAISEVLKVNQSLRTLNLSGNRITNNGVQALGEALKVNQSLRTLDLSGNEITTKGAQALGEVLKVNQSLTTLDVGGNKITPDGARMLAEALNVNQSLTTLNLWNNNIGEDGATSFAGALNVNYSLMSLNLKWNNIADEGAKSLAAALRVNQTLTKLSLGVSKISSVMKELLSKEFPGRVNFD